MVSKITLFEPHFDGAQIGPAKIDTEKDTAAEEAPVSTEHADQKRAESSRRFSKVRTVLGVTTATAFLFAGYMAWRRFKPSTATVEETVEATIEERPVEDLTAE